jgi:predicted transcriptional regulator
METKTEIRRMRRALKKAGVSVAAWARGARVERSTIYRAEAGARIGHDTFLRLQLSAHHALAE